MNEIEPSYILDLEDTYLEGGSASLSPNYSEMRVSFVKCNHED